jgi:hypothetical protein
LFLHKIPLYTTKQGRRYGVYIWHLREVLRYDKIGKEAERIISLSSCRKRGIYGR